MNDKKPLQGCMGCIRLSASRPTLIGWGATTEAKRPETLYGAFLVKACVAFSLSLLMPSMVSSTVIPTMTPVRMAVKTFSAFSSEQLPEQAVKLSLGPGWIGSKEPEMFGTCLGQYLLHLFAYLPLK